MPAFLLALVLTIDAPPHLAPAAERLRAIDREDLAAALGRAGLDVPPSAHVTLIAEDDPRARATPRWIVGRATGARDIVIFPARADRYPYDSLESVMRHELVHLALVLGARGRPLPRWFHEGVATSVESGWGMTDQVRLVFTALREPAIADVSRLFQSESQPDTTLAYLLAAALVDDLRQRHGPALPGRVVARVASGTPFPRAFQLETGESPDTAAARAWAVYRRWINWLPAVTSVSAVWALIVMLSFVAFAVRLRRRARQRRQWDEEEMGGPDDAR